MAEKTLEQELREFREAWLAFAYEVLLALGVVRLAERLGMKPRPWAREQKIRREWRRP